MRGKPLSTDEIDGVFTEDDRRKKNSVYICCLDCSEWTKTTLGAETVCSHCDSNKLDRQSTTSERTFNPDAVKKRRKRKRNVTN